MDIFRGWGGEEGGGEGKTSKDQTCENVSQIGELGTNLRKVSLYRNSVLVERTI